METAHPILLIEGNDQSAFDIQRFLKTSAHLFKLSHAADFKDGLNFIRNGKPSIVLLDAGMMNRKEFPSFRQAIAKENIPLILLTEVNEQEAKKSAEIAGAADYISKNKLNLFHLQKLIQNTLKISEAKVKQEIASAELNTQHHTFSGLLNKINSGMMVINSNNVIRFANEKAYSILSTQETKDQLTDLLRYRASTDDSVIELKPKMGEGLHIRASNLIWDGERANLFVLNPFKIDEEKPDAFLNDVNFSIMLGSIAENVLLLKDNKVVFANKPALGKLRMNSKEIAEKTFEEIIETKENLFEALTIESLLAEKGFAGFLKLSDSPAQKAKFFIKAVNLSGKFYRLLTFEEEREEQRVPKQRTDSELFSTEGVLHMASHDLREPVRTILNYVQLISENLGNKKYEQAIEYADFAKAAAGRMDKLLSDLKTYVALSEHPFELSRVSMKNAVSDVLKQMKRKIEDEKAEISFAELPEVNADRQLVEKLLFQLVDNAILFHRKEKIPVIDIGYDKFENNYIFCVRDNGIGISKKYYQKIFEPFERLNRVDEYPGNGLGLAICKKIVEIHGGEIWVESLPGSGSNFYFTLKGSRV